MVPKLSIVEEKVPNQGPHTIKDEKGAVYGRYYNKKEAQEALDGWNQYYQEET